MAYTILITPTAAEDIADRVEHYNAIATDLGCKPMKRFPFLIMFTIDEDAHAINILRVFNTYQEPLY